MERYLGLIGNLTEVVNELTSLVQSQEEKIARLSSRKNANSEK